VSDPLRQKRIVLLIGHFGRGGCQRQAFLLARELRDNRGLDAEVWSLMRDGFDREYADEFVNAGIPIHVLGFQRPVHSPSRLQRGFGWARELHSIISALRKKRVDVLLPYTTWPNVVAGLSYRLAGVEVCIWGERSAGSERAPTPERLAVRQFRRFVANSTAGVDFLVSAMRVPLGRISLIPNGIEVPALTSAKDWRASLELRRGQLMVVKVANLTKFKDHATLLRAWKLVQDGWESVERPVLVLAGGHGETFAECEQYVREAGLVETVRFPGMISDIPALLQSSDMAAFSSRMEGMPNGVLECMAAGKAIVATDLPGIRDALGQNGAGLLAVPGDHQHFAAILLDLLRNRAKREQLGQTNHSRILTEFSVQHMTDRYLDTMREHLGTGGSTVGRPRGIPDAA
jgi:glycosyltransferase involved in cell wall biosynthesis